MGTRYYGYKVKKQDIWEVVEDIREFYKENYSACRLIRNKLGQESDLSVPETYEEHEELVNEILEFEGGHEYPNVVAQMQLFDISEEYFSFRMLEKSYFFMNNYEHDKVEEHYYDNHTGLSEEEKEIKDEIDDISDMILNDHFFLIPVLDKGVLDDMLFEQLRKRKSQSN